MTVDLRHPTILKLKKEILKVTEELKSLRFYQFKLKKQLLAEKAELSRQLREFVKELQEKK